MQTYNTVMIFVFIIIAVAAAVITKKRPVDKYLVERVTQKRTEWIILGVMIAVAAAVRLIALDSLPCGFNQDEASIGYDSWALANYGVDRNGYVMPVYPVAWGAGHGPFYTYVAMIFMKLFGGSVFVYRLPMALMGVASVPLMYFTVKRMRSATAGYLAAGLLAVCPWHIMLSRWGLDSNPLPFLVLLGVFFFVLACDTGKTRWFVCASVSLALSLYSYGAALVAVPVLTVISLAYALGGKRITWKQLGWSAVAFIVTVLPLAAFYAINTFDLPEIKTALFSIPRLTVMRSDSVFIAFDDTVWESIFNNFKNVLVTLTTGTPDFIWNKIDDYNILFIFTFPLTLLGMIRSFRRGMKWSSFSTEVVMCAWFIGGFVLSLIIKQNINRLSVLFMPMVYFLGVGLHYLATHLREAFVIATAGIAVAAGMFINYYFTDYADDTRVAFMNGYEDAAKYAASLESDQIYCSYTGVNGPFILTLYFCQIPPEDFYSTVRYYDPNAEFRHAYSFGKYVFTLPSDVNADPHRDDVFVVNRSEVHLFNEEYFEVCYFDNFAVVWGKSA